MGEGMTEKKPPYVGFRRKVWSPRNTILGIGKWAWPYLDTAEWWMDAWQTDAWRYLHVPVKPPPEYGDRFTRVYPREHKGRRVTLSMHEGDLYWVYGATQAEEDRWWSWWTKHEAKA